MSHITEVKLKLSDLDAVEDSLVALGGQLELKRDQKTYHTYYGKKACDHAIVVRGGASGSYEIGLVANADGSFKPIYDSWGPGAPLERHAGTGLGKLRQEYAVAVTQRKTTASLARKGFSMSRENLPNGNVRLRLRRR